MSHTLVRQLVIGIAVAAAAIGAPVPAAAEPLPVLMVIANRDYWHQEYAGMREALEKRGLQVVVAAGTLTDAVAQGKRLKVPVRPDLALTDANASDYSAIVFVGGWGASSYQYAFAGTYANAYYRPVDLVAAAVNRLISDFVAQDKPVVALSHAVTVLAWARVDGVSPSKAAPSSLGGRRPRFRAGRHRVSRLQRADTGALGRERRAGEAAGCRRQSADITGRRGGWKV